ncbi:MAG: PEP-CTERM sorting domain-containing protein, partial [Alphaproteobacteria bacterium]|nr:PEP-CTERM sorting domain-containing protein [Alphaproteobacteria bacterium]
TSASNFSITTGFAITPPIDVPAPGTLVTLGIALAGFAAARRR